MIRVLLKSPLHPEPKHWHLGVDIGLLRPTKVFSKAPFVKRVGWGSSTIGFK